MAQKADAKAVPALASKNPPPRATDPLLETLPPAFEAGEIATFARDIYGLDGVATALAGERDQNFLLSCPRQGRFVVKITNSAEDPAVTDLETSALLHVALSAPMLPVPRLRPTIDGALTTAIAQSTGQLLTVRIISFLHGRPFHKAPRSTGQMINLGTALATLGLSLREFSHPAANRRLQWDIRHAGDLRALIPFVDGQGDRPYVEDALARFDTVVAPRLPALRSQVVHNDLNPHNILVGDDDPDSVAGIFDFGDIVHTALINDLAICAAYHIRDGNEPLQWVKALVAGYNRIIPLQDIEIELLPDLIVARHLTTILIGAWRARNHPENRDYILRNAPAAWLGLRQIARLGHDRARDYLKRACEDRHGL